MNNKTLAGTYIHVHTHCKNESGGSSKQWWRYCSLGGNESGGELGLITGTEEIEGRGDREKMQGWRAST